MTAEVHVIAQRWIEVWNSHQVERVLACLTPDVVYEDMPLGAVSRGREEVRRFVAEGWAAFPDLRFELNGAAITGATGTVQWTMLGTHRGDMPGLPVTGKPFAVRGVSVLELAGDRIRRVRDY